MGGGGGEKEPRASPAYPSAMGDPPPPVCMCLAGKVVLPDGVYEGDIVGTNTREGEGGSPLCLGFRV